MLATAFLLIAFTTPAAQGQSALSERQIVLSTGDVVFVGPGTDSRIVLRREADLRIAATPDGREAVVLEVTVLPDGRAGEIKVIRSLDPDLDRAAVASVAKWRFRPGLRNGQPVEAAVGIENCFSFGPAR